MGLRRQRFYEENMLLPSLVAGPRTCSTLLHVPRACLILSALNARLISGGPMFTDLSPRTCGNVLSLFYHSSAQSGLPFSSEPARTSLLKGYTRSATELDWCALRWLSGEKAAETRTHDLTGQGLLRPRPTRPNASYCRCHEEDSWREPSSVV